MMREPIVGTGSEGYRRSAQVIEDELATLPAAEPRRPFLEAERDGWLERARVAEELERGDPDPTGDGPPCVELVVRFDLDQLATFDDALEVLGRGYLAASRALSGDVVAGVLRAEGRRLRIPAAELERRFGR